MRRLVILALAALALAGSPACAGVGLGDTPALSGTDLDGQHFDLAAWRGKIVLVDFWASWCTACRIELPMLEAFARRHANDGVVLIAISEDRDPDGLAAMVSFPTRGVSIGALDDNGFDRPRVLPVTYVVGRDGVVRAVLAPRDTPLSQGEVEAAMAPLLSVAFPR